MFNSDTATPAPTMAMGPRPGDGLLLVDLQRDFMPGGALAVPHGHRVLAPAGRLAERFASEGLPVFASRHWHPANHCSFEARGGPWPAHCVAGSDGAAWADGLLLPVSTVVVCKGTDADQEACSAFQGTELSRMLRHAEVRRLFVAGVATDQGVLHSVLDARAEGFDVVVLPDAIAAFDVQRGDGGQAIERMAAQGAVFVDSERVLG